MYDLIYRWFSWGVASLVEGKSWCLCLAAVYKLYRLVSTTVSRYHCCLKIEEAASHKVKGTLYSRLLVVCLPSGSRTLNLETMHLYLLLSVYTDIPTKEYNTTTGNLLQGMYPLQNVINISRGGCDVKYMHDLCLLVLP